MGCKDVLRFFIVCCLSLVLYILGFFPDKEILSISFILLCILFSVGIGTIVTIELNKIKNVSILKRLKEEIDKLVKTFITYFAISLFLYIAGEQCLGKTGLSTIVVLNISIDLYHSIVCLCFAFIAFVTLYMFQNFIELRKLKYDIIKALNK